jgi:hypothetical protein
VLRRVRTPRRDRPITSVFRNRTSNLGLATQNIQWLILMGMSFTVAMGVLGALGLVGLVAAILLPRNPDEPHASAPAIAAVPHAGQRG